MGNDNVDDETRVEKFLSSFPKSRDEDFSPGAEAACCLVLKFGSPPDKREIARVSLANILDKHQEDWFYMKITESIGPDHYCPLARISIAEAMDPSCVDDEPGVFNFLRVYIGKNLNWTIKIGSDVYTALTVGGSLEFVEKFSAYVMNSYGEHFEKVNWLTRPTR